MARSLVLVCYDIADPKRLKTVFDLCKSYGQHLQYSVFCSSVGSTDRARLVARLDAIIDSTHDRVMLIDLGPDNPLTRQRMLTLGRQLTIEKCGPTIV